MERIRSVERPSVDFSFNTERVELKEVDVNPEAYPGCLVRVMQLANEGSEAAQEAVLSTIVYGRDEDFAMSCGRCGITLVREAGSVYGASSCPNVQAGEISLGILA